MERVNLVSLGKGVVVHAPRLKAVLEAAKELYGADTENADKNADKRKTKFWHAVIDMLWHPLLRPIGCVLVKLGGTKISPWVQERNVLLMNVLFGE
jgi:hypothetical protein